MVVWVRKTMIVADAVVEQCRAMAEQLAGAGGSNMWTRAVAQADAPTVTTHWISAGLIEDTFALLLDSPDELARACQQAGLPVTLAELQAILTACDVSDDQPEAAMARLGLSQINALE